ncbi:interferon-inducible protein AIM2-like [Octodon degus]|uniref:Interferon-inducible protein AIM2-like n=1 Tax=Octodon degus TaxID=10160 RepID=A0A6P6D7J8_OCTDE|nr:interferon-inducible protein AIM2-like [Octodon degus]XP_023555628.1 interferon-inducible protein AIM2-like [Octodon degus]XP_023555629.1 interferon-inducible protein AIM2-like [Octodon degus]
MENAYKEILLVKGLDSLTDEELKRFVYFIPPKFNIAKSKLENASRVEIAELMILNAGVKSTMTTAIKIFKTLHQMLVAQCVIEEKKKVDAKYKKKKMETKTVKDTSQNEKIPGVSAASRHNAIKQPAACKATTKQPTTSKVTTKKPAASKVTTKQRITSKITPQSEKIEQKDPIALDPNGNRRRKKVSVPAKQKTTKCKEVNKRGSTSSQVPKRGKKNL